MKRLASAMTSGDSGESPEEELMDLFTCHRSASCSTKKKKKRCRKARCHVSKTFQHSSNTTKDKLFPFPWMPAQEQEAQCEHHPHWKTCEPYLRDTGEHPELHSMLTKCAAVSAIDFKLPAVGCVSGQVLRHAICVMNGLFGRLSPLIFKIGFTHDAEWRWCNSLYGYRGAKDKWSNMLVLYLATEPHSASMLEAALVEKYKSA